MIEAKELRIRNLVTDEFYDSFKTIIEVYSINNRGINLFIDDYRSYPECSETWIEPGEIFDTIFGIPLTKKLILEFGFKYDQDKGYNSDGENNRIYSLKGFDLSIGEDGRIHQWHEVEDAWYSFKGKEFKFVHKLQNFYYESKDEELTLKPTQ